MSDEADVAAAVAAAEAAFVAWSQTPVTRRAQVMFRLRNLIERDRDEIAALITEEHGKVLHDAKGELQRGLARVPYRWNAGRPHGSWPVPSRAELDRR